MSASAHARTTKTFSRSETPAKRLFLFEDGLQIYGDVQDRLGRCTSSETR